MIETLNGLLSYALNLQNSNSNYSLLFNDFPLNSSFEKVNTVKMFENFGFLIAGEMFDYEVMKSNEGIRTAQ